MEENSSAGAPVLRGSPRPEGQSVAGKSTLPDEQCFTAVFGCNLAKYGPNPFHADTPFGRPISIGLGDYLKASDGDQGLIEELLEALKELTERFRRAVISCGSDPEYADIAVEKYRALAAKAKGRPQ